MERPFEEPNSKLPPPPTAPEEGGGGTPAVSHPFSSSSSYTTADWIQSLVGRGWEIFWRKQDSIVDSNNDHDNAVDVATTTTEEDVSHHEEQQQQQQQQQSVIEEEEHDFEEDWYEALVLSFSTKKSSNCSSAQKQQKLIFNILFVGDQRPCQMALSPDIVRPSAVAWIHRTKAMLLLGGSSCCRRRTAAVSILETLGTTETSTQKETTSMKAWKESLPHDTRTLDDEAALAKIQYTVQAKEFPMLPEFAVSSCFQNNKKKNNQQAAAAPFPTVAQLDDIRELVVLIQRQVYLRSKLARVDDGSSSSNDDSEQQQQQQIISDAYLDYLVSSLQELERHCQWYYQCWQLHARIFGDGGASLLSQQQQQQQQQDRISRHVLLQNYLEGGRAAMISLLTMDVSVAASKKKKKRQRPTTLLSTTTAVPSSSSSPTRRTKRRRKNNNNALNNLLRGEVRSSPQEESSLVDAMMEEDFLLLPEVVKSVVERVMMMLQRNQNNNNNNHNATCVFGRYFGSMLQSLSCNIVAPLVKWQRRVEFYLGDRETLDVSDSSEGETSGEEESGEDDDEDHDENDIGGTTRFVKYEEIEAAIESAQCDIVLKHFELSDFVMRLQQKLAAVDAFARHAWERIGMVLNDNVVAGEPGVYRHNDPIMNDLKQLLQTCLSKQSGVSNVEPIGRASSPLTRKVLENAIVYRAWFLDLAYAETTRERFAFVNNVIARFSELPPLPAPTINGADISFKLAHMAPRVQALSLKLNNRIPTQQNCENKSLLTLDGVVLALHELERVPVLSVAQEELAIRKDILTWETEARALLCVTKPPFDMVASVKAKADWILEGRSPTRLELIRNVQGDTGIDTEIREFAKADMNELCASLFEKMNALFAKAAMWKERADSIVTTLRVFGNPLAGERLACPKLPTMVDLKRINDLLDEYEGIEVNLDNLYHTLDKVHVESIGWSSSVTSFLLDDESSFEGSLRLLNWQGRERPKGIIVDPTRQIVDALVELLTWYTAVKMAAATNCVDQARKLVIEGLEILEKFSRTRASGRQFIVDPAHSLNLLSAGIDSRSTMRVLSWNKLESNALCSAVLGRMIDDARDVKEGCPLLSSLYYLWQTHVQDFTRKCDSATQQRGDFTLLRAKQLLTMRPSLDASEPSSSNFPHRACHEVVKLEQLIDESEQKETEAREVLAASKTLLREFLRKPEAINLHCTKLKELYGEFRTRLSKGLALDSELEQQLDQDVKVFQWLARAFQYPVLKSRESIDAEPNTEASNEADGRIPWDVLVSLYRSIPESDCNIGDFAYVVLRVKELYDAANAWQEEISKLTMLSLRGGKRRSTLSSPVKSGEAAEAAQEEESSSTMIDLDKVLEFSQHPILLEVAMPRENAVRNMLENTKKFESQLYEFLGKDYEGMSPDRAAYPKTGSLAGKDGSFLLYRLTGSPLFKALKEEVASISEIADDVFADTPGKAAFDWIRQAVTWIESLHEAVTHVDNPLAGSRLVIPSSDARRLKSEGERILLNVPDDLRRTLSQHKIYVSANKEGKLTVKSRKGGAHHAVGVTAIHWCPILFDSLKADVIRLESWEASVKEVSAAFISFVAKKKGEGGPAVDEDTILRYLSFQDEIADLVAQVRDMVVFPSKTALDSTQGLLTNLDGFIQAYSTPAIKKRYAETKFKDASVVVRDRFLFLDSLIRRESVDQGEDKSSLDLTSKQSPFRTAGRVLLEKALLKGMSTMDIISDSDEVSTFCAMKAWEIERSLFTLYQGELGESRISTEYRDQARTLKRSLEDPDNLELCARVLTGSIDAEKLASMSSEELASPRAKEDRAKAEAAAKQNVVLTRNVTASVSKTNATMVPSKKVQVPAESISVPRVKIANGGSSPNASGEGGTPPAGRSPLSLGDIVKAAKQSHQPPPPPSLAASLRPSALALPSSLRENEFVSSSSGTNRFFLELAKGTRKFTAGFHAENDPDSIAEGLLPEVLREKGRVEISNFTKFLRQKLDGGRWSVLTLRLTTLNDKHARGELKRFYKEYEVKDRIAMIKVADDSKLHMYLLTPKFHDAFRKASNGLSFDKASSTYAVVLARK